MISEAQARTFAASHFPDAPEKLAEHLGAEVRCSPLSGCDGWCLATPAKAIIHINARLSAVRQRFTLAHELGHLILGVPTVVGETYEDMVRSNSTEERRVNDLASALLIPTGVVKQSLSELPVISTALQKLAKKAKVSELAAAIRVCNLAQDIGLRNASVVLFDGDRVRWQWSKTLSMSNEVAARLLAEARNASPSAFRDVDEESGDVTIASTIENPNHGTATLFVQRLPMEEGMRITRDEQRRALEEKLFQNEPKLHQQVSGLLGAHKNRTENTTLAESEADFWERNQHKLTDTPLDSKTGRKYVKLRLSEWF